MAEFAHMARTTSQKGGAGGFSVMPSEYPRGGSVIENRTMSAIKRPGTPATTNAQRQPIHSFTQPPMRSEYLRTGDV